MKVYIIKLLVFTVGVSFFNVIFCQEKRLEYSFEFSPTFSNVSNNLTESSFTGTGTAISVARVELRTDKIIEPTLALASLITGSTTKSELGGSLGIEKITFIDTYLYLNLLAGAKMDFDKYFIHIESGLGLNLSNKTRRKTEFTNGDKENVKTDAMLNSGEFNDMTIPLILSVARKFKVKKNEIYLGLRAYYGINQIVVDVPRNNHYYGFGYTIGIIY